MTRSYARFAAAALTSLILLTACAADRLPTELDVEPPTPVTPSTPPPSPPPPPAPTPKADNRRLFIWTEEGGFTILENPPGVVLWSATGINDSGEIAGSLIMSASAGRPTYRGFKWSVAAGFTYLVNPDGVDTQVLGIDDQGNVVGFTEAHANPYPRGREVFIWNEKEGFRSLGVSLPSVSVLGIRAGVVFGNTIRAREVFGTPAGDAFRLRLSGGTLELLPTASDVGGGVMDTNGAGDAVGFDGNINHGFGGASDAVIWDRAGNPTIAYDCKEKYNCFAYLAAINSNGIAAGVVTQGEAEEFRIFRWSRSKGLEYLDLSSVGNLAAVAGIKDDGSVVAQNGREVIIVSPSGTVTAIRPPNTHVTIEVGAMNRYGQVVGMLF